MKINKKGAMIKIYHAKIMADKIIKALAYSGRVSVTCIDTTELVEEARKIHNLSPVCTAAFGRLLTMTALMGTDMKNATDKLTIQVKGNGEIGTMVTVADNIPNVRGYVTNPVVDLPLNEFGKLDVSGAVGTTGFINVIKDIGLKEPYVGISPIVSGELAEDFANYFAESEQTNTAVALGVLVDKNGVRKSGGYLITPMPDATEEDISNIEKSIYEAGAISRMLENNLELEEIACKITGDKKIKIIERNNNLKYSCNCSKERMKNAFITIGKEEIKKLLEEDGKAEIVCHFCNKKYEFSKEDLEDMLKI
jgi:molecular chaperone Hsp33